MEEGSSDSFLHTAPISPDLVLYCCNIMAIIRFGSPRALSMAFFSTATVVWFFVGGVATTDTREGWISGIFELTF